MTRIYVAGGCFWGVQAYFKKIRGIVETTVGYLNGPTNDVGYEDVCAGSGHVEVVRILLNEKTLTFKDFFQLYISIINPFSRFKQGNDVGVQYRIGLYFEDHLVMGIFNDLLKKWESKNSPTKIEIKPVENFVIAEKWHQDYLIKNPHGYCHVNLFTIPKRFLK